MSKGVQHHPRYFTNPYPDYPESDPNNILRDQDIRSLMLNKAEEVFKNIGNEDCDGGIYVGPVGATYMYIHIQHLLSPEENRLMIQLAQKSYEAHSNYYERIGNSRLDSSAFLLGKAGVEAVGAVFGHITNNNNLVTKCLKSYVNEAQKCKDIGDKGPGADELFVGRAGYLCGALFLQEKLGFQPVPINDLRDIWKITIESGMRYAKQNKSPSPLMYSYYNTEYLGAAHGLSSIIQMLLSFPEFLQENPAASQIIKETLDFYLSLQMSDGNFPCAMDEIGPGKMRKVEDELVHFCHGIPGAIYMFVKAYLVFQDEKYLAACIKGGECVWEKGLLKKGPGICHGVAGSGYVFLTLYNLLKQTQVGHLYRAKKLAQFLSHPDFKKARQPDCPFSLYEGLAGTVCFLGDILQPNKAQFPFFNIFNNCTF